MKSCRLRATDRAGNPIIFLPEDVPVRIWEDAFILARVQNSPTLVLDSLVRVMDHMDVGEGDLVLYEGQEYKVTYSRGFQLVNQTGTIIPSNLISNCKVLSVGNKTISGIQFRTDTSAFRIHAFLGIYEGKMVCAHDRKPFTEEQLRVSAGFVYQRQKLCYGDIVEGKVLTMWRGRPCIHTEDGYVELPSHVLIGKGVQ